MQALLGRDRVRSIITNERGNVAVIFAITSFVVVSLVGGAVDLGRAYSSRAKLQSALDSAALATASAYLQDTEQDIQAAKDRGTQFFNASTSDMAGAAITSSIDPSTRTVRMTADISIKTPFLSLVGINTMTLSTQSEVTASETIASGGGNGDKEIEMALMLDVTGSMGADDGTGRTKLQAMKTASKALIDILIPTSGPIHAKIALAPFSQTVNLGDAYIVAATGKPLTKSNCTQTETVCVNTTCAQYRSNGTCRRWNQECTQQCTQTSTSYLRRCVTERLGDGLATDDGPGTDRYIPGYVPSGDTDEYSSTLDGARNCTPGQTIAPLTTTKATLKATIDSFSSNGSTAGWLGTAWAWYLLSPEWSGVFTGTGAPRAYNASNNKKIAVLMTDGTYNTKTGVFYNDGSAEAIEVSNNAVAVCNGMKAKGIEVYTVGFKLDNDLARNTLRQCATDADHVFLAEDGNQLEAVFREVAYRSVPLHVAK